MLDFFEHWLAKTCNTIDSPANQRIWSKKPRQLELMATFLPDFLTTSRLTWSLQESDIGRIVKHCSESRLVDQSRSFYTTVVDKSVTALLGKSATMQDIPLIVQDLVSSKDFCERRSYYLDGNVVTIEFDTCFAEEAERASSNYKTIDIHFNDAELRSARIVEDVDVTVPTKIAELTGLRLFAVDYFHSNNQLIVLEFNPLFSWSWMPPECIEVFANVLADSIII